MTTSPTSPGNPSPERAPLRVRSRESTSNVGLNGAWWPQSRDLRVEVADLVDNFPDPSARVTRLLFAGSDWANAVHDGRPVRQVQAGHRLVNVGLILRGATQRVVLMLAIGQRVRLRIIPCGADPAVAGRLLRDGGPHRSPDARTRTADQAR